jgi:hypothetical protein
VKKMLCAVVMLMGLMGMANMSYAGTATLAYTEPSQNAAGNPLLNLKETTIYFKQDGGVEQVITVPAVATGGRAITRTVTFVDPPLCGSTTLSAQVSASNTNLTNFESVRSAVVTATKAASTVGCATPNAPSNITITIP